MTTTVMMIAVVVLDSQGNSGSNVTGHLNIDFSFISDDKDLGQEKLDVGREKSFLSGENTSAKKFLSKKSSVMLPAYRLQKYCVYTLCEHDEVRVCVLSIKRVQILHLI